MNKGKDVRGDHIELIGKGTPGAYLSTNGMDYEFYLRGANTFLTQEKVSIAGDSENVFFHFFTEKKRRDIN